MCNTFFVSLRQWVYMFVPVFFFSLWCLSGCSDKGDVVRQREEKAENALKQFEDKVFLSGQADFPSFFKNNDSIVFLVFQNNKLIYWSDNVISFNSLDIHIVDRWQKVRVDNADCWCLWKMISSYSIIAMIPVIWYNNCPHNDILNSFSYNNLGATDVKNIKSQRRYHLFLWFGYVFIALYLLSMLGFFFYTKLRQNVSIFVQFVVLFFFCFVVSVEVLLFFSYKYGKTKYEQRTFFTINKDTRYIQYALQNLYPWLITLSSEHEYGINIDLRDLAHVYGTDIIAYDLQGNYIGSSSPQLFSCGFLSSLLHPAALYNSHLPMILEQTVMGKKYYVSYIDFLNGSYAHIGYLAIPFYISDGEIYDAAFTFFVSALPLLFIIAAFAFILFSLLLLHHVRLIHHITEVVQVFKVGSANVRIPYLGKSELGLLSAAFNKIAEAEEKTNSQLLQSERESAWRTMARQVAHEINNPLTPMKIIIQQLQRLKKEPVDDKRFSVYFDKATTTLIEQIDGLSHIASSFSNFAKMPTVHIANVDIAKKLSSAISLFTNNEWGIPIRYVGADDGIYAVADRELIGQVFNNIIKNALQATASNPNGDIIVMLKPQAENNDEINNTNDFVEITISDNGHGISEENLHKLFIPNFTTKSGGMGLGLAISKNILIGCGGKISFSTSAKGTTFYIYLLRGHVE